MADHAYSTAAPDGARRAPQEAAPALLLRSGEEDRRRRLEAALQRLEDLRQEMIAELDAIDGDPDLEPEPLEVDADFEPSVA